MIYLDVQRAAEAVSMSPRWIRQQIANGLPCLRTEGKILLTPEELRAWMERKYREQPVDLDEAVRVAEELHGSKAQKKRRQR